MDNNNNNLKPQSIGGISFNEEPPRQQYQQNYQSQGNMSQGTSLPPDKNNKWIIMCVVLAVLAVILLIILISVIVKKDDSSDDKDDKTTIEATDEDDNEDDDEDDEDEDTEEIVEDTTESTLETTEEYVPESSYEYVAPTAFSGEWTDFQVSINDKYYQFPMPYQVLEADGWIVDYDPGDVDSGDGIYVEIESPVTGHLFTFYVTNPYTTSQPAENCFVTGFEVDETCTEDVIKLSDNITFLSSSKQDFQSEFGAPDYAGEYDDGTEYIDYSTDDFEGYMDITLNQDGIFSKLMMENLAMPEGLEISQDISTEAPEINASYVAPMGPSTDIYDNIITVDGDYYKLPCPVSEFTKNGWEIESMTEEIISGGSLVYSAFERDGEKFFCMIRNYTGDTIYTFNGMVTMIDCTEGYADGIEIVFPGNIKIGDPASSFEAVYAGLEGYSCDNDSEYESLSYSFWATINEDTYENINIYVDCDYETQIITQYTYEYNNYSY